MIHFCKIHQTNYSERSGCPLWSNLGDDHLEYQANNDCFPPRDNPPNNPLYKKAMRLRAQNKKGVKMTK